MAKADKKVSIALFDKIAKEQFQNEATIEWHDAQLRVKYALSLTDMLAFVDDVVGSCFHDKLGYMPEVKDFAIKTNILSRYANFSLPDNLEHRYQLVYMTDAVDAVCAAIDGTQLQEIVNSINDKMPRVSAGGDAIADAKSDALPNISNSEVNIEIGPTYIYGTNEDTVEQHREVTRKFTNEILSQLNIKR